ncbi:terminase small subunit [Caballeronia sp. GaOx3]|uniref:terminase small subunit n=1 Tax=Caballeronia sp. GaOx3 TaxID=2921740 RepID=UPI0020285C71|nr:terminase small subunit [Caballeronia sp. GaOx3]
MALTGKKRLFADAVLAGKSNKEAAVAAGYSAKTASAAGARLVRDKDVVSYLAAARGKDGATPASGEAPKHEGKSQTEYDLAKLTEFRDPKAFLIAAMNDGATEFKLRVDAAKALMPFVHHKLGEGGKKEQRDEAAKKVASKFAPAAPPKLVATGGKKV